MGIKSNIPDSDGKFGNKDPFFLVKDRIKIQENP